MFSPSLLRGLLLLTALPLLAAAAELQDPTRPPASGVSVAQPVQTKAPPRWVLDSTLVSAGRRSAVINNRAVTVGERINGALVLDIQPNSVRLRSGGRERTLVLLDTNVKQPSRSPGDGEGSGKP